MGWKDLGRSLATKGLPSIGKTLGGDLGEMVGTGLAAKLALPPDPDRIAAAVEADPSILVRLHEIEARDFAMAVADVQHARENARTVDDTTRMVLACIIPAVAVLFGAVFAAVLVWKGEIVQAVGIGSLILGWLIRDASAAMSFYFGTSLGSAKKSAELAALERR